MLYKQLIILIKKSFCHRIKFMLQSLYKILNDDRSQYQHIQLPNHHISILMETSVQPTILKFMTQFSYRILNSNRSQDPTFPQEGMGYISSQPQQRKEGVVNNPTIKANHPKIHDTLFIKFLNDERSKDTSIPTKTGLFFQFPAFWNH